MFDVKALKKMVKSNKNMSLVEFIDWSEEFERNFFFIYFMERREVSGPEHYMVIICENEEHIELEVINPNSGDAYVETSKSMLKDQFEKAMAHLNKPFLYEINRGMIKDMAESNEKLFKKFQHHLSKKSE